MPDASDSRPAFARFPATHRSAIVAAQSAEGEERERGLAIVAEIYWKPVYKYLRARFGESSTDAADLTQAFFARALEKNFFDGYEPARGSFRTYLRTCIDRFVANEKKAATRQKRSPGAALVSVDFAGADNEFARESPVDHRTVDRYFHDQWVRSIFGYAIEELKRECERRGRGATFHLFERYEIERETNEIITYESLSQDFQVPVTQVTNWLAFARREFRRIVLERVREITASDSEFREEVESLFGRSG